MGDEIVIEISLQVVCKFEPWPALTTKAWRSIFCSGVRMTVCKNANYMRFAVLQTDLCGKCRHKWSCRECGMSELVLVVLSHAVHIRLRQQVGLRIDIILGQSQHLRLFGRNRISGRLPKEGSRLKQVDNRSPIQICIPYSKENGAEMCRDGRNPVGTDCVDCVD